MPLSALSRALAVAAVVVAAAAFGNVTAGAAPFSGPALLTPVSILDSSYHCNAPIVPGGATPVLLIHGTWSRGDESWNQAFVPTLSQRGVPTCVVDMPERATADIQVSVEYAVNAIRRTAAAYDGKIDVIGHSQGGAIAVYAMKYWPDLTNDVDDVVGLASSIRPDGAGGALCETIGCPAPFQQLQPNSPWYQGFASTPLPPGPSFTSVSTQFDEIVTPQPSGSFLPGATNIVLQDVCPGKPVDHIAMLFDPTSLAITDDALDNPGPARADRVGRSTCGQFLPNGVNIAAFPGAVASAGIGFATGIVETKPTLVDPPTRCYVTHSCATDDLNAIS